MSPAPRKPAAKAKPRAKASPRKAAPPPQARYGMRTFAALSPATKRQTVILYGWLTVYTVLLVILFLAARGASPTEIQAQRTHSIILSCEVTNGKHHKLFKELREQKESDAKLPPAQRKIAAVQEAHRATLVETLEPWQDCAALAKSRVH